MNVYTMDSGTEYVLESEMSEADRLAFKEFQTLAQVPMPDGLAEGDQAHYAHDWRRFFQRRK